MGYDIPEPFVWDESFKVFYENLDEEHKGLFQGIFDLCKAPGDQAVFAVLRQRIVDHFKNEEGMMEKANYPEFQPHREIHAAFVKELDALAIPVAQDKLCYAKDWLVNHIKGTDHKYKGKL